MNIRNVVAMLALVLSIPFAAFAAGDDEGKQPPTPNDPSAIQVSADSSNAALNLNDASADEWRGGWGRGGWGRGWGGGWGRGWGGWGGYGGWGGWGGWGWSYPYYSYVWPYYGGWGWY